METKTKGRERIGANRGRFGGDTNYSLRFPFRAGTIEFCARERNRATVSHSPGDFSPFFSFSFFSLLFLHTHSPRTAYKRTSPSVQVYVGPRCTLSGMKRENKRKREEKRGNKIKRFVQRNFLMLLRPDALTDQVGTRRTISVDYGGLHR